MAYNLLPLQQFFDSSGNPLGTGSLTAYAPGTTTAKAIYTDSTGTTELSNPVNFDASGRVAGGIWGTGLYKIKVTDNVSGTGSTIWSLDNISMAADSTAAAVPTPTATPLTSINRLENTTFQYSKLLKTDGTSISSSLSDGAEVAYSWYVLSQTAAITAAKITSTSATLFTTGLRLTQSQAAAQRIGLVSPVSTVVTEALRGQTAQASIYIRPSATAIYRIAVISQTTATDTPTIDVVSNWLSTTYTASNFFIAGSGVGTPTSVTSASLTADVWTRLSTSIIVPDDSVNLIFFVWSESTLTQNTTMDVSASSIYESSAALGWRPANDSDSKKEALAWTNIEHKESILHNSSFSLAQRQVPSTLTSSADDVYNADRWYSLTQTAAIQYQRGINDDTTVMPYYGRIKQNQAAAQRMGQAQILESSESIPLRGSNIYISARQRLSTAQPLYIALLEWVSTADTVTSDIVNDWTSATYTNSNFFVSSATVNILGVATVTGTGGWSNIELKGIIVGANCNNLIVFIWTGATAAQDVTLDLHSVLFCKDDNPHTTKKYKFKDISTEIQNCQRYYRKTYELDTAPGTVTTVGAITTLGTGGAYLVMPYTYTQMRAIPTTVTYATDTGLINAMYNSTAAADFTSNGAFAGYAGTSITSFWDVTSQTSGHLIFGQLTLSSEL